jgi:hypothetical protein
MLVDGDDADGSRAAACARGGSGRNHFISVSINSARIVVIAPVA